MKNHKTQMIYIRAGKEAELYKWFKSYCKNNDKGMSNLIMSLLAQFKQSVVAPVVTEQILLEDEDGSVMIKLVP